VAGIVHKVHGYEDFSCACVYHSPDIVNQHLIIHAHRQMNFHYFKNIAVGMNPRETHNSRSSQNC